MVQKEKARPCNRNCLLKPQFYKSVKKLRYKAVVPREARPGRRTPRKEPVKWEALEQDAKVGRQKDKVEGPRNPWL